MVQQPHANGGYSYIVGKINTEVKVPPGCLFGGAGHLSDQIFHVPGAKHCHYAPELRTLSITYPFCGSAHTDTTDNLLEMCPLKLIAPWSIHYLTRFRYSPNGIHSLS